MLLATWQRTISVRPRPRWRTYNQSATSGKSAHAQWYSDLLPGMIPVALLGSVVYLGLQLARDSLAHEKYLDEARARVQELEVEVADLRSARQNVAVPSSGKSTGSWFRW
ncbi:hypothetical protein PILCRDRAFT_58810 [Piloderma croceum F 1598]|uniref:Uncharacterized protein n=1 Tax=Piloderma croceum (strain F 1598) TaxID=765440 RepID=A0A0C3G412_PILCF|nr:hypothetical protein PILCRDRAFT_58810 [Piloderma croceum F 1598]